MTAENEGSDQSDTHKCALTKQREPGMVRDLSIRTIPRRICGKCRYETGRNRHRQ
jgi:hypothetical protein